MLRARGRRAGGRRLLAILACLLLTSTAGLAVTSPAIAGRHRALYPQLISYLGHRRGAVTISVYDEVAHTLMTLHRNVRGWTASVVKLDILETLLHQRRGRLTSYQRELARRMIENSDNDAANKLWDEVGGAKGVAAFDHLLGLSQTTPNRRNLWGLTRTSAADQIVLLRNVIQPSPHLDSHSRSYVRRLMQHVRADQRWGVSAGPPAAATVGLKDGWLPVARDHNRWAVNSIGYVSGHHSRYVIAVLTQHQPSLNYGIRTIERVSSLVWRNAAVG